MSAIPVLGRQGQEGPWSSLASHSSLIGTVGCSWGKTTKVDLWSLYTGAHVQFHLGNMCVHTDIQQKKKIKLKQCNKQVYYGFLGHMVQWSLLFISSTEPTNLWSCLQKSLWNRFPEVGTPTLNVEGVIIHCFHFLNVEAMWPACLILLSPWLPTIMGDIFSNPEPKPTFLHWSCFCLVFI